MPPRSRLSLAKRRITRTFEDEPRRVFRIKDLRVMLDQHRQEWDLAARTSLSQFESYLLERTPLRVITLQSEAYKSISRYVWGEDVSQYEIFLSVKKNAYLSHATAIFLHALSNLLPAIVYVNAEQSPKPQGGNLSQESLNRAFKNKQRRSRFIYTVESHTATFLSGKNTGDLGVVELPDPDGGRLPVRVTDLERTLIDAVVRPAYAGGISNVFDAFTGAHDRISSARIEAYLKKMNYLYPYHQAIGFLMSRAGYPEQLLARMRKLGIRFDFYLDYGLKDPEYDSEWRVFFPKGL